MVALTVAIILSLPELIGWWRCARPTASLHYRSHFRPASPSSALKNLSGGKDLGEELYVLRDPAVNARRAVYPDVFEACAWRAASLAVTLTQRPHMLSTHANRPFP